MWFFKKEVNTKNIKRCEIKIIDINGREFTRNVEGKISYLPASRTCYQKQLQLELEKLFSLICPKV